MCNSNGDFAENSMMIKGFDDDPDDEKGTWTQGKNQWQSKLDCVFLKPPGDSS